MDYTGVFPKTMFLDDFIRISREELKEECDYEKEAEKQIK
jgi:predicted unusual protein kinase regulating ubiquinone biosynthesis (AarF/ABC1/UbiB family)